MSFVGHKFLVKLAQLCPTTKIVHKSANLFCSSISETCLKNVACVESTSIATHKEINTASTFHGIPSRINDRKINDPLDHAINAKIHFT